MDITQLVDDLKAERDRIAQAIIALESKAARRRGRPRLDAEPARPKRRMSAAAKKRISVAAKKRWALWRKKNS